MNCPSCGGPAEDQSGGKGVYRCAFCQNTFTKPEPTGQASHTPVQGASLLSGSFLTSSVDRGGTGFLGSPSQAASSTFAVSSSMTPARGAGDAGISITRSFQVAGDTFKFFVRVENRLEYMISKVQILLDLPTSLKLDHEKTFPAKMVDENHPALKEVGEILPGKFVSTDFFLYCEDCMDAEINATVTYKDPRGALKSENMTPFAIQSCKYVSPRPAALSKIEFDRRIDDEGGKTVRISLDPGVDSKEVLASIQSRMAMTPVGSSPVSSDLAGVSRDGLDVLLRTIIREELNGHKELVATVVSENQQVSIGMLSEIITQTRAIRDDQSALLDLKHMLNDLSIKQDFDLLVSPDFEEKLNLFKRFHAKAIKILTKIMPPSTMDELQALISNPGGDLTRVASMIAGTIATSSLSKKDKELLGAMDSICEVLATLDRAETLLKIQRLKYPGAFKSILEALDKHPGLKKRLFELKRLLGNVPWFSIFAVFPMT